MKKNKEYSYLDIDGMDEPRKEKRGYKKDRIHNGYCIYDLYDMDFYFVNLMENMLRDIATKKHGCPSDLYEKWMTESYNSHKDSLTCTLEQFIYCWSIDEAEMPIYWGSEERAHNNWTNMLLEAAGNFHNANRNNEEEVSEKLKKHGLMHTLYKDYEDYRRKEFRKGMQFLTDYMDCLYI